MKLGTRFELHKVGIKDQTKQSCRISQNWNQNQLSQRCNILYNWNQKSNFTKMQYTIQLESKIKLHKDAKYYTIGIKNQSSQLTRLNKFIKKTEVIIIGPNTKH